VEPEKRMNVHPRFKIEKSDDFERKRLDKGNKKTDMRAWPLGVEKMH
jgi:hypothetical protein